LTGPGRGHKVDRATRLFHRDGFVAVRDALDADQLDRLRSAAGEVITTLVEADPDASVGGGAGGLPHRYSFGGTSVSRHMFHRPEWCQLIDLPTTTPILTSIFGSPDFSRPRTAPSVRSRVRTGPEPRSPHSPTSPSGCA